MPITYDREAKAYTDDQGNRATVGRFGSPRKALQALRSCTGCTNCWGCTNCTGCTNCDNCTNCRGCDKCTDCRGCTGCTNCWGCANGTANTTSGQFGQYTWWAHRDGRARVGCQEHTPSEWLAMTRECVSAMASDAGDWYDTWWPAWIAILRAQNPGTVGLEEG